MDWSTTTREKKKKKKQRRRDGESHRLVSQFHLPPLAFQFIVKKKRENESRRASEGLDLLMLALNEEVREGERSRKKKQDGDQCRRPRVFSYASVCVLGKAPDSFSRLRQHFGNFNRSEGSCANLSSRGMNPLQKSGKGQKTSDSFAFI